MASPPSTTDPITDIDQIAADVEAAYLESLSLIDKAFNAPDDGPTVAAAIATLTGPMRAQIEAHLRERAQLNYRTMVNPAYPASAHVEVNARRNGDGADEFVLTACIVDTWILVETGAGPHGSDAVVDDAFVSYRSVARLIPKGDSWVISQATEVDRWQGATQCPD